MKPPYSFLSPAVWRWLSTLLLSMVVLLGIAPAARAGEHSLPGAALGAMAATPFERFSSASAAMAGHYELRPVTLAQLEDQLRRPDLQASVGKGTLAVLYPNVSEPFRSAFISMIQGIEERTCGCAATRSIRAWIQPNSIRSSSAATRGW